MTDYRASVVIPTFGDLARWEPLAHRAIESVYRQTVPTQPVWTHFDRESDPTFLGIARNLLAKQAACEDLFFLDADDELAHDCIQHLLAAEGDIRVPHAAAWDADRNDWGKPHAIAGHPATFGIPGMIRRADFFALGGFPAAAWGEDVALWYRAYVRGLRFVPVPRAVYRYRRLPGRRSALPGGERSRLWREMRARIDAEECQHTEAA